MRCTCFYSYIVIISVCLYTFGCEKVSEDRPGQTKTITENTETVQKKSTENKVEAEIQEYIVELEDLTAEGADVSLFDGKNLGQWQITDFGGQGEVKVENSQIIMEMGNDMTGITWTGPIINMDYEISLDGQRVEGSDFFCALTFPVGKEFCSLVCGGWGGSLTGLSSIDYYDAANNETTGVYDFENGIWYNIRLRVTNMKIEAWIDDEKIVDFETDGHTFDTRIEVEYSKPLGIATWRTAGAVRNIRWQKL